MVTIDLNVERQWDELFRRVEGGEVLRVMRGDKEIAVVRPPEIDAERADQADLDAWAEMGLKQLAEAFPPNEFADWEKSDGTR